LGSKNEQTGCDEKDDKGEKEVLFHGRLHQDWLLSVCAFKTAKTSLKTAKKRHSADPKTESKKTIRY
jgi:hypothetical protein